MKKDKESEGGEFSLFLFLFCLLLFSSGAPKEASLSGPWARRKDAHEPECEERITLLLSLFFLFFCPEPALTSVSVPDLHCHCHPVGASTLEKICASGSKNQKKGPGCVKNMRK